MINLKKLFWQSLANYWRIETLEETLNLCAVKIEDRDKRDTIENMVCICELIIYVFFYCCCIGLQWAFFPCSSFAYFMLNSDLFNFSIASFFLVVKILNWFIVFSATDSTMTSLTNCVILNQCLVVCASVSSPIN